jgi:Acetyltransferase (GNAT) family
MIKAAAATDLPVVEGIMARILREDPSYWPHGLSVDQFNGGLYLVKESSTSNPVGFVGWQKLDEGEKKVGYYAVGILPHYRERGFAKSAVAQVIREVRDHCDDVKALIMRHNTPSMALARSLNVAVVEKCAAAPASKNQALAGLVGALGSTVFFDQAANPDRTIGSSLQPWNWDKNRVLMGSLNALLGGVGGHQIAGGNHLTGLTSIALAPTKDLAMKGVGTLHKIDDAATEAAKSFAHDRAKPEITSPKGVFESVPKEAWMGAGGLGLGILGLVAYNASKRRKIEEQRLALDAAGTASVTLPTAHPGDIETQIKLPIGDLQLSDKLIRNLGRDTRRRLRTETRARTKHRNESKSPTVVKSAAELQALVEELSKGAAAMPTPAPAGNVPMPPALGQNPALRMQNQASATANSITPPPAANPAVMQAEAKAMETEQAAMQQQGQMEQASQQAQMEQEQNFQTELAKQEQEKQVLKLQLETEKAKSNLQKEQAKAHVALNKAQADGAASASDGENSVAGRLIANRLDRLQKRVGHIKSAVYVNGQQYNTGPTVSDPRIPASPDSAPSRPSMLNRQQPGPNQMVTNNTKYRTDAPPAPPFKHLKPEAGQLINSNPGANALFPATGIYRHSYGGIGDSMFDLFAKKHLMGAPKAPPRYAGMSSIVNSPDKMDMIRAVYGGEITTNPMLAGAV